MSGEEAAALSTETEDNPATPPPQEPPPEPEPKPKKPLNMKPGAVKLRNWINKSLRIKMSDGRVLIGIFLCTDRDANVILGSCYEFLPESDEGASTSAGKKAPNEEPRMLGLVMVPGKHIVSVAVDKMEDQRQCARGRDENVLATPLPQEVEDEEVT